MGIKKLKPVADTTPCSQEKQCYAKTTDAKSSSKPGTPCLPVIEHLRHAGFVAEELLKVLPKQLLAILPKNSAVFASTHDSGKVSPGFLFNRLQNKQLTKYLNHANHAEVSEAAIIDFLCNCGMLKKQAELQALVAGYHHGRRTSQPLDNSDTGYGNTTWSDERLRLIKEMTKEFGNFPDKIDDKILPVLCGLTCLSDWLASDEQWFNPQSYPVGQAARNAAAKAVRESGWELPQIRKHKSFAELFGEGFIPNEFQQAAYGAAEKPGLYILEAPMGLGKTEAALWAAYRLMEKGLHHWVYFALPTRLTSNRIHQRVEQFIGNAFNSGQHTRLVHGGAWMQLPAGGGEELRPGNGWFLPLNALCCNLLVWGQ